MAEIVLSPLLQVIFDKLASPFLQQLGDAWNLKENFQKLQNTLPLIQALLEDAEQQQVTNKSVRMWLAKLKDVAYDAEDLLDEFTAKGKGSLVNSEDIDVTKPKPTMRDADRVRKMLQVLETTAIEGLNLHLRECSVVGGSPDRRETSSFVVESEVYGREEDKEVIVNLLLSGVTPRGEDVSLIAVVGMGGIGKTTLAQLVYNNERTTKHFDVKIWVFVSDNFDAKKIIRAVIESASKDKCDLSGMDVLHSKLWGLLHRKKYLIVLDDVWNEDQDEWQKLRPLFRCGVAGSKILVTTRSKKVALLMDSPTFVYYLEGLPEDDCWELFKQRAFRRGEEEGLPNLLPIGKQIVKKCGGLPLAAKTLGSLMRLKREEREWLFVQNSQLWNLEVCQSGILPALRLSYLHLPLHLRRCFAFCSVYPKNYEFKKETLIHIWMAEGLILSHGRSKAPEDIGNEYFNDLLWMSFFQGVEQGDNGSMIVYKIHDLFHDLAQSIAGNESVVVENNLPPGRLAQTRHASVICDFRSSAIPKALYDAKHLRTLLLFPGGEFRVAPVDMFLSFKWLRVLDLKGSGLIRLHDSIGNLLSLRFLDLSFTHITTIPRSISWLPFLQTLNLFCCYNLVELPNIARMGSLRHLNISGCEALKSMIPYYATSERPTFADFAACVTGRLSMKALFSNERNELIGSMSLSNQLQILPIYIVDKILGIELLEWLNLRGELKIKHLENVSDADEAKKANLMNKENLELLGLYWGDNDDGPSSAIVGFQKRKKVKKSAETTIFNFEDTKQLNMREGPSQGREPDATLGEEVLKSLQPHQNLKQLHVKGYPGIRFPSWRLPNLIMVYLTNCRRCEHLPVLGNLPVLKTLSVQGMDGVKRIGKEFYGEDTQLPFPSLRELELRDFPNLEEWLSSDDRDAFPSLTKLIVNKCPNLTIMPFFQTLQHLELRDCNPMILESIENLTCLSHLVIEKVPELLSLSGEFLANNALLKSLEMISCPRLHSLPPELGNLTVLKSLTIRWCEELSSLPPALQNLKALESLEISDCHSMVSMPEDGIGGLSSLRTLSVENCTDLTSLPTCLEHLTSLEHLTIMFCPRFGALPGGIQHLSSLRSLSILNCTEFSCLPEGLKHVPALHCLEIRGCPCLEALPEWVDNLTSLRSLTISDCHNLKHLPEGLKLLSALQHLSIQDCPELEKRCKGEVGEDWLKIAHIPHKRIGTSEFGQSSAAGTSSN